MISSALVAYIHYLSFGVIFAALTIEHLTFKPDLSLREAWRILIADGLYGLAAIAVLVTGVLRVMYFGQGPTFYSHNPIFWAKIAVFFVVGSLSLYPTLTFLFWLRGLRQGETPKLGATKASAIIWIVRLELAGFATIPLLATLMARGVGLNLAS